MVDAGPKFGVWSSAAPVGMQRSDATCSMHDTSEIGLPFRVSAAEYLGMYGMSLNARRDRYSTAGR